MRTITLFRKRYNIAEIIFRFLFSSAGFFLLRVGLDISDSGLDDQGSRSWLADLYAGLFVGLLYSLLYYLSIILLDKIKSVHPQAGK